MDNMLGPMLLGTHQIFNDIRNDFVGLINKYEDDVELDMFLNVWGAILIKLLIDSGYDKEEVEQLLVTLNAEAFTVYTKEDYGLL